MRAFLFILMISGFAWAQDDYAIDHYLEFDARVHAQPDGDYTERFYVNSADNSYYALHRDIKSAPLNFFFVAHTRVFMQALFPFQEVFLEKSYRFESDNRFARPKNPNRKLKRFAISPPRDTIIDGRNLVYIHFYKKERKKVKDSLWAKLIIDESRADFLALFANQLPYELWSANRRIPKGLLIEEHHYDGKNLKFSRKLKNAVPVPTTFTVPRPRYRVRQGAVVAPPSMGAQLYSPSNGPTGW